MPMSRDQPSLTALQLQHFLFSFARSITHLISEKWLYRWTSFLGDVMLPFPFFCLSLQREWRINYGNLLWMHHSFSTRKPCWRWKILCHLWWYLTQACPWASLWQQTSLHAYQATDVQPLLPTPDFGSPSRSPACSGKTSIELWSPPLQTPKARRKENYRKPHQGKQ